MSDGTRIEASMVPLTLTNTMRISVPMEVVNAVNNHIDKIEKSKDKISYSHKLAGEIRTGEQIELYPHHKQLSDLKEIFLLFGAKYYEIYCNTNVAKMRDLAAQKAHVQIYDMWYNTYYEGDYNPMHSHGTQSRMGLSSFMYLKMPDQIVKNSKQIQTNKVKYDGAKGINDGRTYFLFGPSSGHDHYDFTCQRSFFVEPRVGDLWIFPKWLEHGVYPFRGDGTRRTLAANMNVWFEAEKT